MNLKIPKRAQSRFERLSHLYKELLRLPDGEDRIRMQGAMVSVRDELAAGLGKSSQWVQDTYEAAVLKERLELEAIT